MVLNTHYNLRSNFQEQDGELMHIIKSNVTVKIDYYGVNTNTEYKSLLQQIISEPFILANDPLFRFTCIANKESGNTIFIPIFHRSIIDGTQFDTIIEKISQYYHNLLDYNQTDEDQIDTLKSYITWEADTIKKSSIDYWMDKIQDYPLHIDLPFNSNIIDPKKPRTNAKLYNLNDALYHAVKKLSTELGCSDFDIFKTVWALLISIYSDQDKVIITYPFNTRRSVYKSVKGAFRVPDRLKMFI